MSEQKRILVFGAHPDDPDMMFGGTAYQLAKAGHVIKFVSVTNGDSGHYSMDRAALAARRKKETEASANVLGLAEYEVFPLHDGELEPTVENRQRIIRCIRKFCPDMVVSHRLCDYHPDHRATARLVLDAAYLLTVPLVCPDVPVPEKIPVFAYSYDGFTKPAPILPDAAVEFDSVFDAKCRALSCHVSQFFEWLPYSEGIRGLDVNAMDFAAKCKQLEYWLKRFEDAANLGRETLRKMYGAKADTIRYAEVFEQSDYSLRLPPDEFARFFLP